MIYLNHDRIRISEVANEWYLKLSTFLTDTRLCYAEYTDPDSGNRRMKRCDSYKAKMLEEVKLSSLDTDGISLGTEYVNKFCDGLREMVLAEEEKLKSLHEEYQTVFIDNPTEQKAKVHRVLKDIFEDLYTDFTNKNAYYFFRKLNIRTCPYCNRNYTFTVREEDKHTRPEFDHFYDKSKNPLLAVSFYNLIPSCHTCNHTKGVDELRVNPYFHGFEGQFKIAEDGTFLGYDTRSEDEKHDMQKLALNGLYKEHDDYVQELFAKAQAYNEHAREALVNSFQGAGESPSEVFEFVWGKNLETARQINRPLSKLTRDVLQQVGVIPKEDEEREDEEIV